ncbi:hypothetical protein HN451_04940, partial [archaeon]|nr:hypothetical protein [archaeon]
MTEISDVVFAAFVGGSSSGKSTIADITKKAIEEFAVSNDEENLVTIVSSDYFYRDIEAVKLIQPGVFKTENIKEDIKNVNWDDPNLIDYDALIYTLSELKKGNSVELPGYDKKTGRLLFDEKDKVTLDPAKIVLVEGFLLEALKKATGKFKKEGNDIPVHFNYAENIRTEGNRFFANYNIKHGIFNEKRKKHERLFGNEKNTGIFNENLYFVHCDENEALFRRLIRDHMVFRRDLDETISHYPKIKNTYETIIQPLSKNEKWKIIDNTVFNENTSNNVYNTVIKLMTDAKIDIQENYKTLEEGAKEIEDMSNDYLQNCIYTFIEEGGKVIDEETKELIRTDIPIGQKKLKEFYEGYQDFKNNFLDNPIPNKFGKP